MKRLFTASIVLTLLIGCSRSDRTKSKIESRGGVKALVAELNEINAMPPSKNNALPPLLASLNPKDIFIAETNPVVFGIDLEKRRELLGIVINEGYGLLVLTDTAATNNIKEWGKRELLPGVYEIR